MMIFNYKIKIKSNEIFNKIFNRIFNKIYKIDIYDENRFLNKIAVD